MVLLLLKVYLPYTSDPHVIIKSKYLQLVMIILYLYYVVLFCLFRGNDNVTLRLCWNVIPIAGQLPLIRAAPSHVIIPSVYS
jgi:hypothetical protein